MSTIPDKLSEDHTLSFDGHTNVQTTKDVQVEMIENAQILWNYMLLGHKLEKSDIILVLGNHDVRTAEYGASLWLDGWANLIMFSGKDGNYTRGRWEKREADVFMEIALGMGVSRQSIYLEREATNTGENVRFSQAVLAEANIYPKSLILVQTPLMERRTYATFMKQWEGASRLRHVCVTSPPTGMREFHHSGGNRKINDSIEMLVECMKRIIDYPEKGFQIAQCIPKHVLSAYDFVKQWQKQ